MKIKKSQLKQIIQEELAGVLGEISTWTGPYVQSGNRHWVSSTPGGHVEYELPGGEYFADTLSQNPNKEDFMDPLKKDMTTHHAPKPAEKYWYSREDDEVYRGKGAGYQPHKMGDPKLAPKVGGTDVMKKPLPKPVEEGSLKQIIMQELAGVLLEKEDPIEPAKIPEYIAGLKSQAAGGEVSAGMAMSTLQAIVDAAEDNEQFAPLAAMAAQALKEIPVEAEKAAKDAVKV